MTLADLGALADLIGSIAVVASLIFVGIQVRQNTRVTRATAIQGAADFFTSITLEIAKNPELRRVWMRLTGAGNPKGSAQSWQELEPEDRVAVELLLQSVINIYDRVHVQYQHGLVDAVYWQECFGAMRHYLLPFPVVREWWTTVVMPAGMFSPAFRDEISREIGAG